MNLDVGPARARPRPRKKWPPRNWHTATIVRVTDATHGITVTWRLSAEGRQWTIPHDVDTADVNDFLVDLGLAGRSVDTAALAGTKARIYIRTFGGRTSGFIDGVKPV